MKKLILLYLILYFIAACGEINQSLEESFVSTAPTRFGHLLEKFATSDLPEFKDWKGAFTGRCYKSTDPETAINGMLWVTQRDPVNGPEFGLKKFGVIESTNREEDYFDHTIPLEDRPGLVEILDTGYNITTGVSEREGSLVVARFDESRDRELQLRTQDDRAYLLIRDIKDAFLMRACYFFTRIDYPKLD